MEPDRAMEIVQALADGLDPRAQGSAFHFSLIACRSVYSWVSSSCR
jgi:hypothetical protein